MKNPLNKQSKNLFTEDKLKKTNSPSSDLTDILMLAKGGNKNAIISLIEKYTPLINKYSYIYKLKDYDQEDLKQEGTIALLKAIQKFDISKNPLYFDGYAINSIRNIYGTLVRTRSRYNDESSLNITSEESDYEIIELLSDNFNIEEEYEKKSELSKLHSLLPSLPQDQLNLIQVVYFNKSPSLKQYCFENNLSYPSARRKIKKTLESLRYSLQ